LLDLGWLRRPPVSGASTVAFCANAAFATVMLYMTLFFQALRGDSPITTGLAFLAFTVPLAAGSPIAGALAAHRSKAALSFAGMVLLAAGTAVLAFVDGGSATWIVWLGLALNGVGQAVAFNVTNIVAIASVDDSSDGMAAGAISGIRQTGSLFGLAIAGAAFTAAGGVTSLAASGPPPPELVDGIHAAMAVTVAFCVAGALAARWARTAPADGRVPKLALERR
jgi:DHA2 family methylenomycin A resistance protein-like MFS transporter